MAREIKGYVPFVSTNPRLDFSFLYPEGWDAREVREENYDEVFITGPRNREDTYSPALIVSVTPSKQAGGEFDTIEELVADYLNRRKGFPNFKEFLRTKGTFAFHEAMEFVISYVMPLPLNSVNPRDTTVVERRIVVKRGPYFYELIYRAIEEDYHAFLDAFRNAARTFGFHREMKEPSPLVTPAPALSVREQPADYETHA
ncbi:MAG: hypothetical protein ACE5MB_08835 [Anaerolineae bacterium]